MAEKFNVIKNPGETRPLKFTFDARQFEAGETITEATVVVGSAVKDLVISPAQITDKSVVIIVSGGSANSLMERSYRLDCTIKTSKGFIYEDAGNLRVKALS